MRNFIISAVLLLAVCFSGCAKDYAYKPIPVKDVSAYPNAAKVLGAAIAAEALYDDNRLKEIFGYNLKKAGVVPVQVVVDNAGSKAVGLVSSARVLDADGQWWEMLPENIVHDRVGQYMGGIDGGALAKKSLVYGVAGAVVGAAVGVVTGTNVGEAAGKGAAVGAAAGASTEILFGDEDKADGDIRRDFAGRALNSQIVPAGTMTHGFLYFPSEMKQPRKLRLALREGREVREKDSYGYDKTPTVKWTGQTVNLELNL